MKKELIKFIKDNNISPIFPYMTEKGIDTRELRLKVEYWEHHETALLRVGLKWSTSDWEKRRKDFDYVGTELLNLINTYF